MQVRRVLMTTDTVGGVWTYALELARALGAAGVSVDLATMGAPVSRSQRREAAEMESLHLFESAFRLEWMEDPWDDLARAGEWLLSLEDHLRPDIVHLNGYAHGALPWRAPVLVAGHSCVLSWWKAVRGEAAPPSWARYACAVRAGMAAAQAVVAPTADMLLALEQYYGPLPRSRVIPNGRRPSPFTPAAKEEIVLTAGRLWDEAKNLATLGAAAEGLAWPVLAAGAETGPGGGSVAAGAVRPLGRLSTDELGRWLGRASIYALPARYEPFGLSALEAALAGCALVLGDIPSLREVWEEAAVFVPPGDARALRAALSDLIADPKARLAAAQAACRRAQRFTPERMGREYLAAYESLPAREGEVSACAS
jgi:glycogen(starch) synthase